MAESYNAAVSCREAVSLDCLVPAGALRAEDWQSQLTAAFPFGAQRRMETSYYVVI